MQKKLCSDTSGNQSGVVDRMWPRCTYPYRHSFSIANCLAPHTVTYCAGNHCDAVPDAVPHSPNAYPHPTACMAPPLYGHSLPGRNGLRYKFGYGYNTNNLSSK